MKSIQASTRTDAAESPDPILALPGIAKPEILLTQLASLVPFALKLDRAATLWGALR
jgi:hypothetical protein